jgi:hypothetical protein
VEANREAQPAFQPGEILQLADLEKLRPLLPPGYLEEFRFPEMEVLITPTGNYSPHSMYQEATEKYAGQTGVAEDGTLLNYVAGQPFPNASLDPADSLAGLKAAWNFNFRWQRLGPALECEVGMFRKGGTPHNLGGLLTDAIQGRGQFQMNRKIQVAMQRAYFSHAAEFPAQNYTLPLPGADAVEYKEFVQILAPQDIQGTAFTVLRPADPRANNEAWAYDPKQRRVRRLATVERTDRFLGTDATMDDFFGFSGKVVDFNWTFHGWKTLLVVINSQHSHAHYFGPYGRLPQDRWEVRKVAVVEATPKTGKYPYGSKLFFWDAQTYITPLAMEFTKEGALSRVVSLQNAWSEESTGSPGADAGARVSRVTGIVFVDVSADQWTIVPFKISYPTFNQERMVERFDLNKLTEGRR